MPSPSLAARPCAVLAQTPLAPPYVLTELDAPEVASRVSPGQFVMVRVPGVVDPLLGRPFSVFGVTRDERGDPRGITLLYNVVGRGTALFAARRPGESLGVLGPLGRGFDLDREPPGRAILVAGGIGIAAFLLLASALVRRGIPTSLLYGARTGADLVCRDAFTRLGIETRLASDDGSAGHKGFVTELLADELAARGPANPLAVYACGPTPMLRRVREQTIAASVHCELALEARMGCGFGVCLGCVVPRTSPLGTFALVCQDGPCMAADQVLL